MSFPTILFLALGLAMDATAAAIARGVAAPSAGPRAAALSAARVGVLFGGFQAAMPLLGWLLGTRVGPRVAAWDHWIAFALLAGIGGKMIWEAREPAPVDPARAARPPGGARPPGEGRVLLLLAVATSLDAFAVGVTLPLVEAPVLLSVVTIGVVTAAASAVGFVVGRRFGTLLGRRLDAAGGIVLIAIGVRILMQHLGH